jgi:hypothetical protein
VTCEKARDRREESARSLRWVASCEEKKRGGGKRTSDLLVEKAAEGKRDQLVKTDGESGKRYVHLLGVFEDLVDLRRFFLRRIVEL